MNEEQQIIQAFAKWGAQKYGKGKMKPEDFLEQVLKLDKKQQQALMQEFQLDMQNQTQRASSGAKLNYIKSLNNQCSEDEELVFMKKGGVVCSRCLKKAMKANEGTKIKKEAKGGCSKAMNGIKTELAKCGSKMKK